MLKHKRWSISSDCNKKNGFHGATVGRNHAFWEEHPGLSVILWHFILFLRETPRFIPLFFMAFYSMLWNSETLR